MLSNGVFFRRVHCGRMFYQGVALAVCASRLATAQGGVSPTTATSGFALGSADPSADTGRMVPAHAHWGSYTTAGQCVAAMQTAQRRAAQPDDAMHPAPRDRTVRVQVTLLTQGRLQVPIGMTPNAIAAGRACAQGLTLGTAPAATLPDYLLLALLFHDDTLATAVVHRQLALASTPRARIEILASAFAATLVMSPPRADLAAVLLRPLDSLPDAWIERFYARKALMSLAPTPAAKAAYEDTLVTLSTHFTPAALEQGLLGINVFDLYRGYLAQLRGRTATDAAAATLYRMVRARYLALGAQLRAAGILDRDPQRLMYLNNAPPPL